MNFSFPYIGKFIIPTDELHHFSEGWVETTNQYIYINNHKYGLPSGKLSFCYRTSPFLMGNDKSTINCSYHKTTILLVISHHFDISFLMTSTMTSPQPWPQAIVPRSWSDASRSRSWNSPMTRLRGGHRWTGRFLTKWEGNHRGNRYHLVNVNKKLLKIAIYSEFFP